MENSEQGEGMENENTTKLFQLQETLQDSRIFGASDWQYPRKFANFDEIAGSYSY